MSHFALDQSLFTVVLASGLSLLFGVTFSIALPNDKPLTKIEILALIIVILIGCL